MAALAIGIVLTGCGTANDDTTDTAADTKPAVESDSIADFYEEQLEKQDEEAEIWAKAPNDVDVLELTIDEVIEDVLSYAENEDMVVVGQTVDINEKIRLLYIAEGYDAFEIFQFLCDEGEFVSASTAPKLNLRNQTFTRVSTFSEGLAWVQYLDDNSQTITSVINTDGHFLALEHISTFDTEEWRFGSLDKDGNVLIAFDDYNNEIIDFSSDNLLYRYNRNEFSFYYAYLEEGMFDLISSLDYRVLYNVRDNRWVKCHIDAAIRDADVLRGVFRNGYLISHRNDWNETYVNAINTNGEIIKLVDVREYSFVSSYSEGVAFCGNAYYDINGDVHISFPQYESRKFGGGTFNQGFAPLYVEGVNGKDYFTIIDSEGNFIACKAGSNIPTVFIGIDGSYIGQ